MMKHRLPVLAIAVAALASFAWLVFRGDSERGPEGLAAVSAARAERSPSRAVIVTDKDDPRVELSHAIETLEARRHDLESHREALLAALRELGARQRDRKAAARAQYTAPARISDWGFLNLTGEQQRILQVLWTKWDRRDLQRPIARPDWRGADQRDSVPSETWRAREDRVRTELTSDQARLLHEAAASNAVKSWDGDPAAKWGGLAPMIGTVVGIETSEGIARLRESMGALTIPEGMLLAEAHELEGWRLVLLACARVRPALTPEQRDVLDRVMAP